MGTFSIQRSQRGITPASGSVRANINVDTGAGAVGVAVAELGITGRAVLKERQRKRDAIEIKRQEMTDGNSSALASSMRKNADEEFTTFKIVNPQETWQEERERINEKASESISKLQFSTNALITEQARSKAWAGLSQRKSVGDATRQLQKDTIDVQTNALLEAFRVGSAMDQATAATRYARLGANMGKDKAEVLADIKEAKAIGFKERKETAEKAEKNATLAAAMSQRDEDGVLDVEKADEVINSSGQPEGDKVDLRNQIENRSNQEQKRRDAEFADRTGEEDARLNELLLDDQLTIQEIDLAELEAVGKQKTFEKNWKANWKADLAKINALAEPASSVESVYDNLVIGSEQVERGTKSPAEWETQMRSAWADGQLSKEDRRSLRSKDIVATKTMQNRAFMAQTDGSSEARFALVEATEDQLASFTTARDLRVKAKDFTAAEALNKAIQKGQIQRWNFGRYRDSLRTQMSQNPEWSQKQIFTASDILTNEFDKDFEVLVKEFDAANPTKAITKNPPDEFFKDIWKDLSVEDKAKIWELRMHGATVEEIAGELIE